MKPLVGVLAVQGAFAEMAQAFRRVGAEAFEIRSTRDLEHPLDALALPGGESTVQGKLLHDTGLFDPLAARISDGLPVFATCAGLILLAERIEDDPTRWFAVLPVTVRRNAYGRQLGSFATTGRVGEDDVRAAGCPTSGFDAFALSNAMIAGRHRQALEVLASEGYTIV